MTGYAELDPESGFRFVTSSKGFLENGLFRLNLWKYVKHIWWETDAGHIDELVTNGKKDWQSIMDDDEQLKHFVFVKIGAVDLDNV